MVTLLRRLADGSPMRWNGRIRLRAIVGVLFLCVVPSLAAAVFVVPLFLFFDLGTAPAVLAAVVVGVGSSALLGPIVVGRTIDRLPKASLEERPEAFLQERVGSIAADVGIDPPEVVVVNANAANVCAVDSYRGTTIVASTRLLSLDADARDAAVRHAMYRVKHRDAAVLSALLPLLAAVEVVVLLGLSLVGRRGDRDESDRNVNRIHGYEPERGRVPAPVYTLAGIVLLAILFPAWAPFALGERLYVSGSRRAADVAVSRSGNDERQGLADAVEFARGAAGASDWTPTLDRLSLVPMADERARLVRGTSRQEERVRLAVLRSNLVPEAR